MSALTDDPAVTGRRSGTAVIDAPASAATAHPGRPWWRTGRAGPIAAAGLLLLVAASLYLRTQAITAKFWIDEGLSVGIADHRLVDIPSVLRKDGSPPLYYMLLHVWNGLVGGDGEARSHALSLLFATGTIPAGWWLGRRLFGVRAGWATAALCATNPFLTYYAQETRMYALMAFLGLLSTGVFALAFAARERRAVIPFGLLGALTIYSHNWGLFLVLGLLAAFAVLWRTAPDAERRPLLRDGLLGFGTMGVLYLPWVPTLLYQAAHTGAPWSERPAVSAMVSGLLPTLGGAETALVIALVGIAGILTLRGNAEGSPRARAALAVAVTLGVAVVLAFLASQASPAWANRYFAVFVGPLMLLAGAGLVRYGKVGLVALAVILVLWFNPHERSIRGKSDAYRVARTLQDDGLIAPRDLVVAVHPEYAPVMRYYLGDGYQWADALGPVSDTRVFDWRDALARLEAAGPRRTLNRLAPLVAPGRHLVLILPILRTARWGAPWTSEIRHRTPQWEHALDRDPRFVRVAPMPQFRNRPLPRGVRAVVYLRR
jgi:hypothetical protein